MSEWISVDDRLPDNTYSARYIVFAYDMIFISEFHKGKFTNGIHVPGWETECENVTHWMPLPEPPETPKAHWIERLDPEAGPFLERQFVCSACGNWQTYGKTKYCPNCGERMDLDEQS